MLIITQVEDYMTIIIVQATNQAIKALDMTAYLTSGAQLEK